MGTLGIRRMRELSRSVISRVIVELQVGQVLFRPDEFCLEVP
jgi:hypothetical protein